MHCFFVIILIGDYMRKRHAKLIVFTSSLGILFIIINTLIVLENSNPVIGVLELFKYFTVQSNLIVLIYFSLYIFSDLKELTVFNKMFGGVVIYITMTFLVFFVLLQPIYSPKGLALIGSIFNHYITSLLVIGFLWKFREDYKFSIKHIKKWIVYPLIYLIFLFAIGLITGDFIYPFLQVGEVGITLVLALVVGIVILFLIMSFCLVKIVSKSKL